MIWGGDLTAENAFFLRYHDQDADAHALQVWQTEAHDETETAYRLGFTIGADAKHDIAWCGASSGAELAELAEATVYLPPRTAAGAVLYWTTAVGTEMSAAVADLPQTTAADGGILVQLDDGLILAESLRLE